MNRTDAIWAVGRLTIGTAVRVVAPLRSYGVPAGKAIAYGFGLQAIEASVGIGVGLIFLAREGLSFAMLRRMPGAGGAGRVVTRTVMQVNNG